MNIITRTLKTLRVHLRGKNFFYKEIFSNHTQNFKNTTNVVRLFYGISFIFGISEASWGWPDLFKSQFVDVLWPFYFLKLLIPSILVPFGFLGWCLGSFCAAINPDRKFFRILHALSVFTIIGLRNSDGHFGHSFHAYLWISIIFACLPNVSNGNGLSRSKKHKYILFFWFSQFAICVFYFMTGVWKVIRLYECLAPNIQCELSEKILTNIAAQELIQYRKFAPLAWLLFAFPWLGFFSYLGTLWIHIYSIHFAFRLQLHTFFGFLRIIFHLGTLALFGINFAPFTLATICVFVFSPFSRNSFSFLQSLKELPFFDKLYSIPQQVCRLRTYRNLLISGFILFTFLVLEIFCYSWMYFNINITRNQYSDQYSILVKESREARSWMVTTKMHPFWGYVLDSDFITCNDFGFNSMYNFSQIDRSKNFVIGVFGGNIADQIGEYLESHFSKYAITSRFEKIAGERIPIVINFSIPGYRQPQQLLVAQYFFDKIDVGIFIEGANEVSANPFPDFPVDFPKYTYMHFKKNKLIEYQKEVYKQRLSVIHGFHSVSQFATVLSYSASLLFIAKTVNLFYKKKIERSSRGEEFYNQSLNISQDETTMQKKLIDKWKQHISSTWSYFAYHNKPLFVFIEPNQYTKRSQNFKKRELRKKNYYNNTFGPRFDLLVKEGKRLKNSGLPLCDFSDLFLLNSNHFFNGAFTSLTSDGRTLLTNSILNTIYQSSITKQIECLKSM